MGDVSVQESIEEFIRYFSDQIDLVDAIAGPDPQQTKLCQKILFAILLDTLSIAARPDLFKKNRERFSSFIDSCSAWQDKDRVSCLQLKLDLEQQKLTDGRVYEFVNSKIKGWPLVELRPAQADPIIDEVLDLGGTDSETAAVKANRYTSLLYAYRNSLLHEFRQPGYGMELSEDDSPFYHSMLHASGQEGRDFSWQLSLPLAFFRRLCVGSIRGLRELLTEEQRNPFDAYPFGSRWKPR